MSDLRNNDNNSYIMFVYFIDESGESRYKPNTKKQYEEPIFVIGGVIIQADDWQNINNIIIDFKKNYFPDYLDEFNLHAVELANGLGMFANIPQAKRDEIYESFFEIIAKTDFHIIASSISKKGLVDSDHNWDPLIVGFESITRHYDRFLSTHETNGVRVIDDKGKPNEEIKKLNRVIMREGIDLPSKIKITKVIPDLFFQRSKECNLLQFADMVAFTILRNEVGLLYKKSQRHDFFKKIFNRYLEDKKFYIYKYPQYP